MQNFKIWMFKMESVTTLCFMAVATFRWFSSYVFFVQGLGWTARWHNPFIHWRRFSFFRRCDRPSSLRWCIRPTFALAANSAKTTSPWWKWLASPWQPRPVQQVSSRASAGPSSSTKTGWTVPIRSASTSRNSSKLFLFLQNLLRLCLT